MCACVLVRGRVLSVGNLCACAGQHARGLRKWAAHFMLEVVDRSGKSFGTGFPRFVFCGSQVEKRQMISWAVVVTLYMNAVSHGRMLSCTRHCFFLPTREYSYTVLLCVLLSCRLLSFSRKMGGPSAAHHAGSTFMLDSSVPGSRANVAWSPTCG